MLTRYVIPWPIMGDICCHTFCYFHAPSVIYVTIVFSLNFVDLISIAAVISTQFSMMSHNENEAVNAATFRCFAQKLAILWAIWPEIQSEMALYNILSTLEKFEHRNRTVLITKYQRMKWL